MEARDSIMQIFKLSPLQAGLEFSIHKPARVAESAGLQDKLRPRTDKQLRHSQRKGWLVFEMRTPSADVIGLTVCWCVAPSYSLVPAPCASANSSVGSKGSDCCSCSDLLQHVVTNTATSQICPLQYKGPAAFSDFLATARPQFSL